MAITSAATVDVLSKLSFASGDRILFPEEDKFRNRNRLASRYTTNGKEKACLPHHPSSLAKDLRQEAKRDSIRSWMMPKNDQMHVECSLTPRTLGNDIFKRRKRLKETLVSSFACGQALDVVALKECKSEKESYGIARRPFSDTDRPVDHPICSQPLLDFNEISLIPSTAARFERRLKLLKATPGGDLSNQHVSVKGYSEPKDDFMTDLADEFILASDLCEFRESRGSVDEAGRIESFSTHLFHKADRPIALLPPSLLLEKIAAYVDDRQTWNAVSTLNRETLALSRHLEQSIYRPWPHVRRRVPTGRPWTIALGKNYLCCGTDQGGLLVWKVYGNGSPICLQGKTAGGRINSVQCFEDWVISGGDDNLTRIWNIDTGLCEAVLDGHSAGITCVATLNLETTAKDVKLSTTSTPSMSRILVATASRDCDIQLFILSFKETHVTSTKHVMTINDAHRGPVHSIALYKRDEQNFLVSGGGDERLLRWPICPIDELTRDDTASTLPIEIATTLFNYEGDILRIVVSNDSENRIAAAFGRNVFVFWQQDASSNNTENGIVDWSVFKGHSNNVRSIDFSPCGKKIATGCSDGSIRLWDLQRGIWIRKWIAHDGFLVSSLAFSLDGKSLLSAGSDGTIVIESV
jgi:WD40 repeat protein